MERNTDLITLNSPNHHLMLARGLWNMYQSTQGVDFDIGWGVWAHRCVLDVFLSTARLAPSDTERLLDEETLNCLMEFLYTGQVTVHRNQLTNMLETAKESGFQLLVDAVTAANHNTSCAQHSVEQSFQLAHLPTASKPELQYQPDRLPGNCSLKLPSEPTSDIKIQEQSIPYDSVESESTVPESTVVKIKQEPPDVLEDEEMAPDGQLDVGSCLQLQLSEAGSAKEGSADPEEDVEDADSLSMSDKSKGVPAKKRRYTRSIAPDGTKLQHVCNECGKVFPRHYSLMRHALTHTGERPYTCAICGKMFQTVYSMNDHQLTHNRPTDTATLDKMYPHKCGECGKAFPKPYALMLHSRVHTGERPFTCDVCGKAFKYKHARNECNHKNMKPHVCSECGHSFAKVEDLEAHRRIHAGEKLFECETCGKVFKTITRRARHLVTHSCERPFICSVCGKSFSLAENLRVHSRTHSGIKPFECETCGRTFRTISCRNRHLRTHINSVITFDNKIEDHTLEN